MPLVAQLARDVRGMFSRTLDVRDLEQAGHVGLLKAAATYDPRAGAFVRYAYHRIRGAIIDSQKGRAYREERNVSLQAVQRAHDGWLPPALDTDGAERPNEAAERQEIRWRLRRAIRALPVRERYILMSHLRGRRVSEIASDVGQSITWTRVKLGRLRETVGRLVRGGV